MYIILHARHACSQSSEIWPQLRKIAYYTLTTTPVIIIDIILTVVASDRTVLQSCLQKNLDAITNWVMSVKLCLNVKKTKMMLVARRRRQHELGNVIVTLRRE